MHEIALWCDNTYHFLTKSGVVVDVVEIRTRERKS